MANDPELGKKVNERLVSLGIETPTVTKTGVDAETEASKLQGVRLATHDMLDILGLDLTDDSICDTPKRLAKMYVQELFYGLDYNKFPACTVVDNKMNYKEMVIRDGVDIKSMCEHHFLPIVGKATIAYLPQKKVLGLSKMDRIADFFSRRPQVQERLTEQIAAALKFVLETDDVAVVIRAQHFCVSHRGVGGSSSDTVTSRLHGKFFSVPELRAEFLQLSNIA